MNAFTTSITKNKEYHNKFNIKDEKENKVYFEDLELHTIELNKFGSEKNKDISSVLKKIKTSSNVKMLPHC